MRASQLFLSVIHLVIALIVLATGFAFLIIPFMQGGVELLVGILQYSEKGFLFVGLSVLSLGLLLLLGLYSMHKRRYYKVQMGSSFAMIEDTIIRDYVKEYWQGLFPNAKFDLNIVINKGQKIEVITQIPQDQQVEEEFFKRVQNELGLLLFRKLGYQKDFILTITD